MITYYFWHPTDFEFMHLIHECFVVFSSSCIYPLDHIFRFHQETFTAIKSKVRHYIQQIYINVIAERKTTERCKVAKQMPCQFWPNQNKHKKNECSHNLVSVTHKVSDHHLEN
jgi:hypothetical protein